MNSFNGWQGFSSYKEMSYCMIKTNNRLINSYSTNQRKLSLIILSQSIAMILVFLLASIVQCSKHERTMCI